MLAQGVAIDLYRDGQGAPRLVCNRVGCRERTTGRLNSDQDKRRFSDREAFYCNVKLGPFKTLIYPFCLVIKAGATIIFV